MPQLDVVTYVSQFCWLVLSLSILYVILTTWFLPIFKSNILIRKSLKELDYEMQTSTQAEDSNKALHILRGLTKL